MRRTVLTLATSLILGAANVSAQSNWDAYKPSTLASIVQEHQSAVDAAEKVYSANTFPSRVRVIWTGQLRQIDEGRKAFIHHFFAFIRRPEAETYFRQEILVSEGDRNYWLPIQDQLIPHLQKEVAVGEGVLIFIMWLGVLKTTQGFEWVFAVNEFNAIK